MTREERKQLIGEAIGEASMCWGEMPTGVFDSTRASKIVDRVVAALEKEREGEKVLSIGVFYSVNINLMDGRSVYKAIASNQQGQLIFRPTKAEKGGE